jgi:predicted nucleic acid-binding protein
MIGPHDLQIAATGLDLGYEVATLNAREFQRVAGLVVTDRIDIVHSAEVRG